MDGNGRWAKQHDLPRLEGHRAGVENIRQVIEVFAEYSIKYLSLFAFSTENWQRPRDEVKGLLKIQNERIDQEVKLLHEKNIRVCHLGQPGKLSPRLQRKIRGAIELTQNNTQMTLNVAFDYGGRTEILDAVRRILNNSVPVKDIHENSFREHLYLPEMPDPDLIIRTGGEMRLSNFSCGKPLTVSSTLPKSCGLTLTGLKSTGLLPPMPADKDILVKYDSP